MAANALTNRPATLDDLQWLADAYIDSLQAAITAARGYWDETKEREQFLRQLRLSATGVLSSDATAVGFCTAWFEPDHLFLGTLCIVPEYQNKGFGTLAMRMLAQHAGNLPVRLSVLKSNPRADRFYQRLGCLCVTSSAHHHHLAWIGAARSHASILEPSARNENT